MTTFEAGSSFFLDDSACTAAQSVRDMLESLRSYPDVAVENVGGDMRVSLGADAGEIVDDLW